MNPNDFKVGISVMHGCYAKVTPNSCNESMFIPSGIEGIVKKLRKSITYEKGRKQYTVEFGKRKAYYPEIKITDWYATIVLTDGDSIEINTKNLKIKSRR